LSTLGAPALALKDAALALEDQAGGLPPAVRAGVVDAVQRLLLAAWQLDAAGESGDQPKATHASEQVAAAVETLGDAFEGAGTPATAPYVASLPYTYWEHVFPILRDRCGACHVPGGPAPIPLLSFRAAASRADAIREHLTTAAMPPWFVTAVSPTVRGGHGLSNRERDILLTWSASGTPEGDRSRVPEPVSGAATWPAGPPDHVFELPGFTLGPGVMEERRSVTVATGLAEAIWVRGADVLPTERAIVRSVTVRIAGGPVLAAWVPGETMIPTPAGTAFRVPAGAPLTVDVHYRKHREDAPAAQVDRTRIGLYVTGAGRPTTAVATLPVEDALPLDAPVRVLAVRTVLTETLEAVYVEAALPSGQRMPLLDLRGARSGWGRRYWLRDAVDLPAGAVVGVHVSGDNPPLELLVAPVPAP
jgi:hypothetical protein